MPTPIDAVQPGAADVANPSPVDTSAGALAGPQPDASQMQQLPQNDGQPLESNPTAEAQPPAPQKPAMWKHVLQGALAGLEMGGGIGALVGAVDPNAAIQSKQNRVQAQQNARYFESLQSAHEYQTNAILQHQMSQWPESLQLAKAKSDTPIIDSREKNGWRPVAFGQGVGDKAMMAVTQQLKQIYPKGIPAGLQYLWSSDGVHVYDPAQAGAGAVVDDTNTKRAAMGLAPVSFSDIKQDKGGLITKPANAYQTSPVVKGSNAAARWNNAKSLIAQYEGYDKLNQGLPAGTDKKEAGHQLNVAAIENLKAQMDQARKDMDTENDMKAQLASRSAEARGKAYAMWRPVNVIDPATNQAKVEWAFQAVGSGASPLAEGAKLEAKTAQIGDIAQGSRNMREDLQKLQTPFSDAQLVALTAAMRQTDDKAIKQIVDANLGPQQLSPDQEQYVTDLLNLHERAMAMRSVAGIGNQGSDAMRAAIVAMLPQPKDTPELALRKLDRFDQQIAILTRGIPSVKQTQPKSSAQPQAAAREVTATGPNGHKIAFRGGKWVDAATGAPVK